MTIDEARTLSELRDLLIRVQPLIEKASRVPGRSGTEDKPLCIPLNGDVAAHLIALKRGTIGVLFIRSEHPPARSLPLPPEPV